MEQDGNLVEEDTEEEEEEEDITEKEEEPLNLLYPQECMEALTTVRAFCQQNGMQTSSLPVLMQIESECTGSFR